jgi:hypothetical protein
MMALLIPAKKSKKTKKHSVCRILFSEFSQVTDPLEFFHQNVFLRLPIRSVVRCVVSNTFGRSFSVRYFQPQTFLTKEQPVSTWMLRQTRDFLGVNTESDVLKSLRKMIGWIESQLQSFSLQID